jgi:type IV pilus assembly protein PilE
MKRSRGFTLIELMIVVLIIATLALLALSSYTKQIRKSRRAEAREAVSAVALRQEKWRSNHPAYLGTDSAAGDKTSFGTITSGPYYTIAISSLEDATGYATTAVPKGDQAVDSCATLTWTMDDGVVTKTPATPGCW